MFIAINKNILVAQCVNNKCLVGINVKRFVIILANVSNLWKTLCKMVAGSHVVNNVNCASIDAWRLAILTKNALRILVMLRLESTANAVLDMSTHYANQCLRENPLSATQSAGSIKEKRNSLWHLEVEKVTMKPIKIILT